MSDGPSRSGITLAFLGALAGACGSDRPGEGGPAVTARPVVLAEQSLPSTLATRTRGPTPAAPLVDLVGSAVASSPPSSIAVDAPTATVPQRTYFLDVSGTRGALVLPSSVGSDGVFAGDDGSLSMVDASAGPDQDGRLSVHVAFADAPMWLRARVVRGVLVGRWAASALADTPPPSAYQGHVTGWNQDYFDRWGTSRVFDLVDAAGAFATLRLDRLQDGVGTPVGRWKTYGSVQFGSGAEGPEIDLSITGWEGSHVSFRRDEGDRTWTCEATMAGRSIDGGCTADGAITSFSGSRSEVLGYGLSPRSPDDRDAYQRATRAALRALIMAGDPEPTSISVEVVGDVQPPADGAPPPDRDDDPDGHPAAYARRELYLHETFADPYGGPDVVRDVHAWLAVPLGDAPDGGFPAVVALNGHVGSAAQVLDPSSEVYWYGDAFARRGRVVLAVDVSHRPLADRASLYSDYDDGDDPSAGNGSHPAIRYAGFDSDWEEDGERVADARLARRLLVALPYVDASRILVTGISMGAEVTTYAAALEPGFAGAVAAGFSPDLGVLSLHGNHACWQWQHASVREYLGVSDLHALIAPRPLVVETGRTDNLFSSLSVPFASDKQVLRRSRVAYDADAAALVHYLHYDVHHYHVGDVDPTSLVEQGVRVPVQTAPDPTTPIDWQTSGDTTVAMPTLFSFLDARIPPHQ
jgi:dienelactone hydrolase